MTKKNWDPKEDAVIRAHVERHGATNKEENRRLAKTLRVTRHQLRNRMNNLGLTAYGRRQLAGSPDNPTDKRVMNLEQENRFQDSELKKLTRKVAALQDNANIIQVMRDEIHEALAHPLTPLPQQIIEPAGRDQIEEDLVMHLSDEHADQNVLAHRVLDLEDFNFSTALARAEQYVNRTIRFTQHTLQQLPLPTPVAALLRRSHVGRAPRHPGPQRVPQHHP
jgi:hypothetical protein